MKIIIPMAEMGQQFAQAGYDTPKPLILVDGKPMIEHVVSMFPSESDFIFICNSTHLKNSPMRQILRKMAPAGKIVEVLPHRLGPVYSVLQAVNLIDDDEPVIVNYCDFISDWDYEDFKRSMERTKCAGSVTVYRGFLPRTLSATPYAYLRELNQYLLDIKEQEPFTNDRANEYVSTGTYYFQRGSFVKRFFSELMERKISVRGEYYVSLAYNLMVEAKLPVYVYDLKHFVQWRTPENLALYQGWSDHFCFERIWHPTKHFGGQCLVPMTREEKRFSLAGFRIPKPLIPIDETPMIIRKIRSSPIASHYFFVLEEKFLNQSNIQQILEKQLGNKARFIGLKKPVKSQLSACLKAEQFLDMEKPLLIEGCDNVLIWNESSYLRLIENSEVDSIIWTFHNRANTNHKTNRFGRVSTNNSWVQSVSVKTLIGDHLSDDPGVVGTFWFRKARYFFDAAHELVRRNNRENEELHVDSCFNVLMDQGIKAVIFDVKRHISFETPDDLRVWNYWSGYFSKSNSKINEHV